MIQTIDTSRNRNSRMSFRTKRGLPACARAPASPPATLCVALRAGELGQGISFYGKRIAEILRSAQDDLLPNGKTKFVFSLLLSAIIFWFTAACSRQNKLEDQSTPPLVETVSSGPISLAITAEPPQVHLDRDILLTFRVSSPSNIEVRLPPLENRLKGFVLNGAFVRDSVDQSGKPVKEHCFRLTPTIAEEYRIAPMAITWVDRSKEPATDLPSPAVVPTLREVGTKAGSWFATKPLSFGVAAITKGPPPATIHDIAGPVWIYPPFKTVAFWIIAGICAAGIVYLAWWLSRRIHKAIILRRMSPRERALYELNELLAQHLVEKEKIKEFYLEITMIVRRYIERAHAVRAPEQTTEEFLLTAAQNPDFTRAVVAKLKAFLQTADLVKFAAFRPERAIIDQTVATAQDYIETDEKDQFKVKED